jgi:hypothetical protein
MDARDLEVRCSSCGAGFAIGTRRCIHCGQTLAPRGAPALTLPSTGDAPPIDLDGDGETAQNARRNSMLSGLIMLALVVGSTLLRACS